MGGTVARSRPSEYFQAGTYRPAATLKRASTPAARLNCEGCSFAKSVGVEVH